jgi:hypothetical protein
VRIDQSRRIPIRRERDSLDRLLFVFFAGVALAMNRAFCACVSSRVRELMRRHSHYAIRHPVGVYFGRIIRQRDVYTVVTRSTRRTSAATSARRFAIYSNFIEGSGREQILMDGRVIKSLMPFTHVTIRIGLRNTFAVHR